MRFTGSARLYTHMQRGRADMGGVGPFDESSRVSRDMAVDPSGKGRKMRQR